MEYQINSLVTFTYLVIVFVLGWISSKRRLGFWWGLAFASFWLLPGLLAILSSPRKGKFTLPKKREEDICGVVGFLCIILAIEALLGREIYGSPQNFLMTIYFSLFSYYFFTRVKRNKRLYTEQLRPKPQTEEKLPTGEPPPAHELDIPIYDQV